MFFGIDKHSSLKREKRLGVIFAILGVIVMITTTYCGENLKFSYPIESVTVYCSEHNEVLYKVEYTSRIGTHKTAIMTEDQFKDFKDGKKIKLSLHDEDKIMIKRTEGS